MDEGLFYNKIVTISDLSVYLFMSLSLSPCVVHRETYKESDQLILCVYKDREADL